MRGCGGLLPEFPLSLHRNSIKLRKISIVFRFKNDHFILKTSFPSTSFVDLYVIKAIQLKKNKIDHLIARIFNPNFLPPFHSQNVDHSFAKHWRFKHPLNVNLCWSFFLLSFALSYMYKSSSIPSGPCANTQDLQPEFPPFE